MSAIRDGDCEGLASGGGSSSHGFAIVPFSPDVGEKGKTQGAAPKRKKARVVKKDFKCFSFCFHPVVNV